VAGLIEHPVAVPGPALIMVAKAVTVVPTSVDRLVGNTDETSAAKDLPGIITASATSRATGGSPNRAAHPDCCSSMSG